MNHTNHKRALEALSEKLDLPITTVVEMLDRNGDDPTEFGKTLRGAYATLARAPYVPGKPRPFPPAVDAFYAERQAAERLAMIRAILSDLATAGHAVAGLPAIAAAHDYLEKLDEAAVIDGNVKS